VALATLAVTGLPLAVVTAVQAAGLLRSTLASVAAAAALSLLVSAVGSAFWKRRRRSRDIVFADLMVWGWIRRLRAERRLSDANELLGELDELTGARRAELLERLSASLEARDPYTHGHSRRVTRYAEAIARGMGLPREEVARVRTAAAVHDVGKLHTPREVLNKPGRLTDEEFAAIKRHPGEGAEMVAALGDDALTAMVRHHHERLDGRGYPDGLAGEAIPLGARIIAVADTFDAITSSRSYGAARSHKMALDTLRKESGVQLDAGAVSAFLGYYSARRSVAWSALATSVPQRFFTWLSAASHGVVAGAALGAAALSGLGSAAGPFASAPETAEPVGAAIAAPSVAVAASPVGARFARSSERRSNADSRSPQTRGRRSPARPERPISGPSQPTTPNSNAPPAQPAPADPSRPSRDPLPAIRVPRVDIPPADVSSRLVPLPSVNARYDDAPSVELPDPTTMDLPKVEVPDAKVPPLGTP
jgi:putative nucleotidyltransferase with HDIG domain